VRAEITASYHCQVIWIRVMVEVAEIAEVRPLLCEALQKIVLNGRIVALIFEDDDKHVIEMFWSRRRSGGGGGGLRKTESCDCPEAQYCMDKAAAIPVSERHGFSNLLWP
jgi:hypothetical protein